MVGFGDADNNKEAWDLRVKTDGSIMHSFKDAINTNDDTYMGTTLNKQVVLSASYNSDGVGVVANQLAYENGANYAGDGNISGASTGDALIAATPKLFIGSRVGDGRKLEGDIAEVIIYTRVLSDAERQDVEAYLAQKWMEEPYYTDCIHAEDSGETVDGSFTVDTDGYNGPRAPFSVTCDFSSYANLVAWWRLDETSGTTAADETGSNDGTIAGGTLIGKSGIHGHGMEFDGTDDYISTSYAGITGTASRTFSAWVKINTAGNNEILSYGTEAAGQKMSFYVNSSGNLRLEVKDGAQVGTTTLNVGEWYHVAATLDDDGSPNANEIKLYVNGVEESSYTSTGEPINTGTTNDVRIGDSPMNSPREMDGSIDDVRIYDIDLTAAQILELYNQGKR